MKFWKLGVALSLTVAFGLTACDESSTEANGKTVGIDDDSYEAGKVACVITSRDPFVQEMRMDDLKIKLTVTLEDGKIVETIEHNKEIPQDTCDHYKMDPLYESVTCEAQTITAVNKSTENQKVEKVEYEALTGLVEEACKQSNGQDIPKREDVEENIPKLDKCTAENKDTEAEVFEGKGVFVVCDGKNWVPSKVECEGEAKVDIATFTLACKDGKWTLEGECEDGKTETKTFPGVEVSATCTDGAWVINAKTEAKTENAGEPATEEASEE